MATELGLTRKQLEDITGIAEESPSWECLEEKVLRRNVLGLERGRLKALGKLNKLYLFVAASHGMLKPRPLPEPAFRTESAPSTVWRNGTHHTYPYADTIREPLPTDHLPGTIVEKDGIVYALHGIRHTKAHTDLVNSTLAPRMARLVVLEPLLSYGLPGRIVQPILDEVKYAPNNSRFSMLHALQLSVPLAIAMMRDLGNRKRVDAEVVKNYRSWANGATGDRVSLEQFNLPPRLEADYLRIEMERKSFVSSAAWRSLSQAEFLEATAKKACVKEAHWLGGGWHEPQLAFFLRNPDFAEKQKVVGSRRRDKVYNRAYFMASEAISSAPSVGILLPIAGILLGAALGLRAYDLARNVVNTAINRIR